MYIDSGYDTAFIISCEIDVQIIYLIFDYSVHQSIGDLHWIHIVICDI